ncbi:conserved membrane protein of unknown function [Modestobacter italicus]|uniref:Uncharacterized protein n=1 Tax=Modestobacter italicus (strain DSM 44449 / CECT 9708 / BC 501) TaxID=2732864 RepID=I4ESN2_MODI5|nr:hypothetical protein [Modestobacter marinus]CCH86395.1 conserved membrane protein of unknown function [Modestobacter marinus]
MPSALVDARTTLVAPATRSPRRLPAPVAAAAALAVLQSLGLLALGLTSLDGVFGTGVRPDGLLVAVTLVLLAGWVVLCAGGGASLVDGAGRQLLVAVACGEIVLLLVLAVAGVLGADGVWVLALGPLRALPVPALALLTLGVPTAKLLLATAPSSAAWVAAGGRPRTPRPAVDGERRVLRGVTVACIGLALTGVAVLGGPAAPVAPPSTAAVVDGT